MSLRLTGLASGLDTDSIISSLMSLESAPRTQITNRQTKIQAQQTALQDIDSKLGLLKTAAQSLRSFSTWTDTQQVTSSDETKVTARRTGGAASGGYEVEVQQLASAAQKTFGFTSPASDTTLTVGGRSIALTAGATVDDAVTAINGDGQTGLYAVNVGGSLVLSSKMTGAASTIAASGGPLAEDASKARVGADAQYTVDGQAYSSSTNVVTNGLAGVELTLKAKTGSNGPITVNVGTPQADTSTITSALKNFVTSYNNVVDAIRSRTTEEAVPNASSAADLKKGSLHGDTGLNAILGSLRDTLQTSVAGNPAAMSQLAQLGLSTGDATATISADSVAGKLTLDTTKLSAALADDPQSVQRLLGGLTGTDGYAQAVEKVAATYSDTDGVLEQRVAGTTSQLSDIAASLTSFDDRMTQRQALLQKQFAAMEAALSANQSAQTSLTSLLNQLG